MAAKRKTKSRRRTTPRKKPASKKEGSRLLKYLPIFALLAVYLLSCAIKLNIIHSQTGEGYMIDWGDTWSFLTVIEVIKATGKLPVEDLFFGGIPYVYPPLSLITYTIMYRFLPFSYVFLANNIMPLMGSLAVLGIYYLTFKVSGSRWAGVLAAYMSLFSPRYQGLSSIPIPEMVGHIIAPIFMYLVYLTFTTQKKNIAILAGFAGASLFLTHHLTAAVLFVSVILFYIIYNLFELLHAALGTAAKQDVGRLLIFLKKLASNTTLMLTICSVSFLLSSPWWVDTINKDIMNLVVSEGGGATPYMYFPFVGGPHVFYLGVIALTVFFVASIVRNKPKYTLIFVWGAFTLASVQTRVWVPKVFAFILKDNPRLLYVLSPIYGTRFFDYYAQPMSIMVGVVLVGLVAGIIKGLRRVVKHKMAASLAGGVVVIVLFTPLVYSTVLYGFNREDPILYGLDKKIKEYDKEHPNITIGDPHLDVKNWALRSLRPDIDNGYEYKASLKMREILPPDAQIITDYPGGEVVSAGALRMITSGAELRVTVNLVPIYVDIITIYYTPNVDEAVSLMKRRDSTHIYISDRMIERGWFSVEGIGRFPESRKNHGLEHAELEKFETSPCFKKVMDTGKVRLYELVC